MKITLSDFKPAREFARRYGVKSVVYSGAGEGKTPICAATAPNACFVATEPGMMSIRKLEIPTIEAYTSARIDDCMEFFKSSAEASKFDTIIMDSASELCEIKLREALGAGSKGGNKAHGQAAYGEMSMWAMKHLNDLYFLQNKHVLLISKLQKIEEDGVVTNRPYYPGREMPIKVPHLFDLIMRLGTFHISAADGQQKAFLCKATFESMARDRSGNLNEYEPPNIAYIFNKCMQ